MAKHEREAQKESWWTEKVCPLLSGSTRENKGCLGGRCALWLITRIDEDQEQVGVCTLD